MSNTKLFVPLIVVAATTIANAGGQAGSLGVGAEAHLSGITGISANYDAGKFHVGGVLGYYDPVGPDNMKFEFGGRFFYHVHSTAMADFSLGSGIGVAFLPAVDENYNLIARTRRTNVYLEPGFQVRLFIASNVALSFSAGFVLGLNDASDRTTIPDHQSGIEITGQFNGVAGVHYYFF